MRKEFEEWYEREGKTKPFATVSIKDKMFDSWRASRGAMKPIKLPDLPSVHDGYTKHEIDFMAYAIGECKEAIQQAGYKVDA